MRGSRRKGGKRVKNDCLTVGSLFSGIGGIELGLERTGKFQTKWFVENDKYAKAVLRKHWKDVPIYDDVTAVSWGEVEKVDVLTGGFPCQPFSVAGKRKGEKDERALWTYFLKAIRQVKPKWVLAENVPGLISIDSGRAFRNILASLAEVGYDAEWFTLRASDFGAPHRRKRLFIVAYPSKQRLCCEENERESDVADSDLQRNENGKRIKSQQRERMEACIFTDDWGERIQRFKQESLQGQQGFSWCENIRRVEDFFNRPDSPEPLIRRKDYGLPAYVDRIRCLGNAVVPQVAQFIGEQIKKEAAMKNEEVAKRLVKAGVVVMPEELQWYSCPAGCEHEKNIISCSCECHDEAKEK